MCGTSSQQANAYAQAQSAQSQLMSNMNNIFSTNNGILANITGPAQQTVAKGPNQFGFSPEKDANLKTNILETNAAATRQASNKAGSQLAATGDPTLASGSRAAIAGNIAEEGALATSGALQNETAQGYAKGNEEFNTANNLLANAPGALENPGTQAESGALAGTENLSNAANSITASNRAWEKLPMGGIAAGLDVIPGVGGLAGKALDAADSYANSQA